MPEEQGTELYTWGQGVLGQLGHGDEKPQNQPRLIVSFLGTNVKAVSCGNQHTAVLLESGEVYSFGRGNFGQLGLGSLQAANVSNPTVVEGLQGKYIVSIACGWHHTAALTDSGQLYTWGSGEYGRLGHGDENRQNAPKVVEGLSGKSISFIACGGFHTAAITDRGALYTWGGGYFGQLGQGDEADKKMPRSVKGLRDKVMKQVACGTHHTLALSENSEVFAWGAGEYGKLGLGDEEKHTSPVLIEELQGKGVRSVACGGFHSVALSDTGSVYCWGGGDKGQLGLGNDKSQTLPCVVDALQNKTVVNVSCGMHHTAALLDTGNVYLWGAGEYGRLGLDDEQQQNTPSLCLTLQGKGITSISCGGFHTAALAASIGPEGGASLPVYAPRDRAGRTDDALMESGARAGTQGTVDAEMTPGATRGQTRGSFATKKSYEGEDDGDEEDFKLKEQLRRATSQNAELQKQIEIMQDRHKLENTRLEGRVQASQEERNHLRKQLERMQEKQQADANLKARVATQQEELVEMRKKFERSRGDLKQRTVDVHMLQVRVAQLCGSELDGLTVSQLEELERMQTEAIRRVGVAKYSRLRQEFQEKEDKMREEVDKMKRGFEEQMTKMRGEVSKIQEEKVHLMGLEQRLRQEFQTQVQAEQMSNEELRIRLETLQDGFVQLRSILRREKQSRADSDRHPMEDM